jgi:hypothetical protein
LLNGVFQMLSRFFTPTSTKWPHQIVINRCRIMYFADKTLTSSDPTLFATGSDQLSKYADLSGANSSEKKIMPIFHYVSILKSGFFDVR